MALTGLRRSLAVLARLPLAVRGALAFLSRIPVDGGEPAWDAFRRTPAAFPLSGYVLGALVALPFALGLGPAATVTLYLVALYGLTGITHVDGLADLADAAAVHRRTGGEADRSDAADGNGDAADAATDDAIATDGATDSAPTGPPPGAATRRAVLKDASTGVGGTLAVAFAVVALSLAAAALVPPTGSGAALRTPNGSGIADPVIRAVATIVAAEVGAKAGMGVLACLGAPAHEGLGSQLVAASRPGALPGVALAVLPAAVLAGRGGVVPLAAVALAGPAVALAIRRWARGRLGGVSGDVFGAANELGRIVGLHVGVIAWTLS